MKIGFAQRIASTTWLNRHSVLAMLQSVSAIGSVLLSYKILIYYRGQEELGLWAILTALTAVARAADVSGGSALPRFVAISLDEGSNDKAIHYIDTTTFALFGFYALICLVLWVPITFLISLNVGPQFVETAHAALPFVLGGMVCWVISTSMVGALDGLYRADQRALAMISSFVINVLATLILVPRLGLIGMGLAQIIQYLYLFTVSRLLLRMYFQGLKWLPTTWNQACFRDSLSYGLQVQATNILALFVEPATRLFLNHFGNLNLVAIYDMANKIVVQPRSLTLSAISPLVPRFATAEQAAIEVRQTMIGKANDMAAVIATGLTVVGALLAPPVSYFLLGKSESAFLVTFEILMVGQMIATLTLVQYSYALAVGKMKYNTLGYGATSLSTVCLSALFGTIFGSFGVIVAAALSIAVGALIWFVPNFRLIGRIPLKHALHRKSVLALYVGGMASSFLFLYLSYLATIYMAAYFYEA